MIANNLQQNKGEPCERCGLWDLAKHPGLLGSGNSNRPLLAIVSESPSFAEDSQGEVLAGHSGYVIRELLAILGISVSDCWSTFAIRCKCDKANKVKHIGACRGYLVDELRRVKPKAVLMLGAAPYKALTDLGSVMAARGEPVELPALGVLGIPTVSPGYVLHNPAAMDFLLQDFSLAIDLANAGATKLTLPETDYRIIRTASQAQQAYEEIKRADLVAWDTETTGLSAFAEDAALVCLTFSTAPGTGWLLPFEHSEKVQVTWGEKLKLARFLLQKGSHELTGQNLKFDAVYCAANGIKLRAKQPAFDCYLAAHLLDENASEFGGNSLKRLAWRFSNMGGYERPLQQAYPDMYENMKELPLENKSNPAESLLYYACGDVDVALQATLAMGAKLSAMNLSEVMAWELFKQELLIDMEISGAAIDWEYHSYLSGEIPTRLALMLGKVRSHALTQQAMEIIKQRKIAATTPKKSNRVSKPKPELEFNPGSTDHVRALAIDVLKLPPIARTDKGKVKVDNASFAEWAELLPDNGEEAKLVAALSGYKKLQKLDSTYVSGLLKHRGRDGLVHTRFNQARVVTWRLSSEAPNLQNLPRATDGGGEDELGKSIVKRMYIAPKRNWWVAEVDYSQIELRIAALISQDRLMLQAYIDGKDLHTDTASRIFNVQLSDVSSAQRTYAKSINFGVIYAMGPKSLAARVKVDEEEARQWIRDWYKTFSGYDRYAKRQREFVCKFGYVESMFGHRRHLPNALCDIPEYKEAAVRQAVNSPIQNTASNMLAYGAAIINSIYREQGMQTYCYSLVHDSVWSTGPDKERDRAIAIQVETLENLPFGFLHGEDARWPVSVPIKADVKIGRNMRDLQKYEAK